MPQAFGGDLLPSGADPLLGVEVTALWAQGVQATCQVPFLLYIGSRSPSQRQISPAINWPDIRVTFDYSIFHASSQPGMNAQSSAVVWLGATERPADLMDASPPITLLNNLHLAASYTVMVSRKTFNNNVRSFLGIVEAYNTFGIADIVPYGNDPDLSAPRKPNTSSLRLFQLYDPSAVRITQDTTVNSFLYGLSNLGGLYTTANGIFLFVFGFGLVAILGLDRFSILRGIRRREESTEEVTGKRE
ncbi:hypothetical protein BOTBODRAFT_45564 [Botryobasidium botryosum FD-172 SS1]|uniref:Uncharacterized protein n=1 Tax=Botryobasidium botryosum (strain FD-172 SS1) TaxID=930990 RepID=A0A067MBK9_BOTB1|nr:hypothetical protein BOTBODRAFT_45564 [Botryobasidium botryosum FD-172 SS1]